MQRVIDEINSKFTFSISDDKISVHNKKEVAYVELTTIDDIVLRILSLYLNFKKII